MSGPFGLGEKSGDGAEIPELLPGQDITLTTTIDNVPAAFVDTATVKLTTALNGEAAGAESSLSAPRFPRPSHSSCSCWLCSSGCWHSGPSAVTGRATASPGSKWSRSSNWSSANHNRCDHRSPIGRRRLQRAVRAGRCRFRRCGPGQATGPAVTVDRADVNVGDQIALTMSGFEARSVVMAICGNEAAAVRSTATCRRVGSRTRWTRDVDGRWTHDRRATLAVSVRRARVEPGRHGDRDRSDHDHRGAGRRGGGTVVVRNPLSVSIARSRFRRVRARTSARRSAVPRRTR